MAGMISIKDVVHVMLKEHRWVGGARRIEEELFVCMHLYLGSVLYFDP